MRKAGSLSRRRSQVGDDEIEGEDRSRCIRGHKSASRTNNLYSAIYSMFDSCEATNTSTFPQQKFGDLKRLSIKPRPVRIVDGAMADQFLGQQID
jgi:hypothetical protein